MTPSLVFCMLVAVLTRAASAAPLGVNLSGVRDWSTAWPFVDCFKTSRRWVSQPADGSAWSDNRPVETTPEGWVARLLPNQLASTLMFRDTGPHYPAGTYVCLYEGAGEIRFDFDARVTDATPGRIELNVTPSNAGIHLVIAKTDPDDPIRNIRVLMPGFEQTYAQQVFHPEFLASLKHFTTLRFMDWLDTNNSPVAAWDQRAKLTDASWAWGHGVPVEIMVELCNRLDADPWFCMPHLADDDYVERFARLVAQTLEPQRRAYVEHSNEVWNGGFAQHRYAREQARTLGIPGDAFQSTLRYHAQRCVEIFDVWDEALPPERLVRVLAGQHANPWTGLQIMGWKNAAQHADVYATAPYFGGAVGRRADAQSMSVEDVLDFCRNDLATQRAKTGENLANAKAHGLALVAYEAGQHLTTLGSKNGENRTVIDLLVAANRSPAMEQLYRDYLSDWDAAGGGLMCIFSHIGRYGRYGSWGGLEYQQQPLNEAPKMRAIVNHAQRERAASQRDTPRPAHPP